ncbi:MAG: hypothetical protein GQ526_01575 [Ardenticatenales bacterium]|nr:hypothetical protein [Ardenticatenales bacterium]
MNESLIPWFEVGFNVMYLAAVWYLVWLMSVSMSAVAPKDRKVAGLVRVAFILLAAGDTGHVGFRVLAYASGGIDAQAVILGSPMSLIGLGMLTTSVTVTLFYMLLVYVWQRRNREAANWATNLLQVAGVVRLMMLALPGNDWGASVPPQPMSLYRNVPLMVQGAGILALILFSAYRNHDTTFKRIGWMIAVSFAFYTPVILFAQQVPMLGLLMIPKTCAYLAIAIIAYRGLWSQGLTAPKSAG